MKDENAGVDRERGIVRLKRINKGADFRLDDSAHFSLVSLQFVFLDWSLFKNGKFDLPFMGGSVLRRGELPNDMIQARSQVVNDLASENAKPERDGALLMVLGRLQASLRVVIGEDRAFACLENLLISA